MRFQSGRANEMDYQNKLERMLTGFTVSTASLSKTVFRVWAAQSDLQETEGIEQDSRWLVRMMPCEGKWYETALAKFGVLH